MAHKKMTEELTKNDSAPIGIIFFTTLYNFVFAMLC
jgi:hypothetical protein